VAASPVADALSAQPRRKLASRILASRKVRNKNMIAGSSVVHPVDLCETKAAARMQPPASGSSLIEYSEPCRKL